jgi:hypothetical protein
MVATAKRFATYADLQALPAEVVGEILGGELVRRKRPVPLHAVGPLSVLFPFDPPEAPIAGASSEPK